MSIYNCKHCDRTVELVHGTITNCSVCYEPLVLGVPESRVTPGEHPRRNLFQRIINPGMWVTLICTGAVKIKPGLAKYPIFRSYK